MQKTPGAQGAHGELVEVSVTGGQELAAAAETVGVGMPLEVVDHGDFTWRGCDRGRRLRLDPDDIALRGRVVERPSDPDRWAPVSSTFVTPSVRA